MTWLRMIHCGQLQGLDHSLGTVTRPHGCSSRSGYVSGGRITGEVLGVLLRKRTAAIWLGIQALLIRGRQDKNLLLRCQL